MHGLLFLLFSDIYLDDYRAEKIHVPYDNTSGTKIHEDHFQTLPSSVHFN